MAIRRLGPYAARAAGDLVRPENPSFRFIDLFAGIGGIRLGLQQAGGECVYSVEIDKFARKTYIRNFGSCEADDIRDVPAAALPRL